MEFNLAHRSIFNCLELAAEKGELINTTRKHRKLGKTTALVEFARLNDLYILTPSTEAGKIIEKYFKYKKVKSINSKTFDGIQYAVIEEGCTNESIQELKNKGVIVVTGYLFDNDVY